MKTPVTVMVVEDNKEFRKVIHMALLRDEGLELTSEFGTAEIALRTLLIDQAGEKPDVVLLDLNLPDMSGMDVLRTLRVAKINTPIMITAKIPPDSELSIQTLWAWLYRV